MFPKNTQREQSNLPWSSFQDKNDGFYDSKTKIAVEKIVGDGDCF